MHPAGHPVRPARAQKPTPGRGRRRSAGLVGPAPPSRPRHPKRVHARRRAAGNRGRSAPGPKNARQAPQMLLPLVGHSSPRAGQPLGTRENAPQGPPAPVEINGNPVETGRGGGPRQRPLPPPGRIARQPGEIDLRGGRALLTEIVSSHPCRGEAGFHRRIRVCRGPARPASPGLKSRFAVFVPRRQQRGSRGTTLRARSVSRPETDRVKRFQDGAVPCQLFSHSANCWLSSSQLFRGGGGPLTHSTCRPRQRL